jgi:uncharacterized protein (TIGR02246 family)
MPNRSEVTARTDEEQIKLLMDEWHRRTKTGDVDGLLALLTEDVVFLAPGKPPITKQEFADGFREVSAKARIDSTQEIKDLRAAGDLAYAWSRVSVVATPFDGGEPWQNTGYVLTVFHRSAGRWLLARDANLMKGAGDPNKV